MHSLVNHVARSPRCRISVQNSSPAIFLTSEQHEVRNYLGFYRAVGHSQRTDRKQNHAFLRRSNVLSSGRDTSVTASAESGGVEFDHQSVETEFTSATATAQVTTSEDADERKPSPSVSATATASTSASTVVEMPTPPPFPVDFSTTESSLRTAIFQGDVDTAAKVLGSSRVVSLGAGLTYPAELAFLVQPSRDRNQDPDVVAFKVVFFVWKVN